MSKDILVIGAGVTGLTAGICLREAGLKVTIVAENLPQHTTSATAGAIWGPYEVEPFEQVDRWGHATLTEFQRLSSESSSGVRLTQGRQVSRHVVDAPLWSRHLDQFEPIPHEHLRDPYRVGWRFVAPVLDMPRYMAYLTDRFEAAGGTLRKERLYQIPVQPERTIVNCTGVGARSMVPDSTVKPIRGRSVIVSNPGIAEFFVEMRGTEIQQLYLFPHSDTVALGGTLEEGVDDLASDPKEVQRILDECIQIEPALRQAEVIKEQVGLRPSRPQVRFELVRQNGSIVFHNYGHGGGGVSVSWGSAREMTEKIIEGLS